MGEPVILMLLMQVMWRPLLGSEHFLDHVARCAVEEKSDENGKQHDDDRFENDPAIVVPQDITNRLQRIQKPNERRIWPTAKQTQ